MNKINFYEFIGIMIGDGCVLYYPHHKVYGIEITGNADEERDYYQMMSEFLEKKFKKIPRVYIKHEKSAKCLKLVMYGKKIAEYFIKNGITCHKTYTAIIKDNFLHWNKSRHIIRGIFETDGSLYFSKAGAKTRPDYPRLTIKTSSPKLAEQIKKILKEQLFRVHSHKDGKTEVIYLSGTEMLEKWIKDIGLNSEKNITKYKLWKKLGHYIPRISLRERKALLNSAS